MKRRVLRIIKKVNPILDLKKAQPISEYCKYICKYYPLAGRVGPRYIHAVRSPDMKIVISLRGHDTFLGQGDFLDLSCWLKCSNAPPNFVPPVTPLPIGDHFALLGNYTDEFGTTLRRL